MRRRTSCFTCVASIYKIVLPRSLCQAMAKIMQPITWRQERNTDDLIRCQLTPARTGASTVHTPTCQSINRWIGIWQSCAAKIPMSQMRPPSPRKSTWRPRTPWAMTVCFGRTMIPRARRQSAAASCGNSMRREGKRETKHKHGNNGRRDSTKICKPWNGEKHRKQHSCQREKQGAAAMRRRLRKQRHPQQVSAQECEKGQACNFARRSERSVQVCVVGRSLERLLLCLGINRCFAD